jgi:hypothetical protein
MPNFIGNNLNIIPLNTIKSLYLLKYLALLYV